VVELVETLSRHENENSLLVKALLPFPFGGVTILPELCLSRAPSILRDSASDESQITFTEKPLHYQGLWQAVCYIFKKANYFQWDIVFQHQGYSREIWSKSQSSKRSLKERMEFRRISTN
jgi:hypothetical protein